MPIRWTMAGSGSPVSLGPQTPNLCSNRSHCRGSHNQSSRKYRGSPKLGLSLYLDSGCSLFDIRALAPGIYGGSQSIHGLAQCPLLRTQSGRIHPIDVWHRRSSQSDRRRIAPSGWPPPFPPRAYRQWSRLSTANGYVRRTHGRGISL